MKTSLCCFFLNDTAQWLSGPSGDEQTRILTNATVIKPDDVEQFLKENHILRKYANRSISMHILEASYSLKRKLKLQ